VLTPARLVSITQRVAMAARPAKVWKALTDDVAAWWGAPYLVMGARVTRLVLELKLGGRFFEAAGADGVLWGTVTRIEKERVLQISGPMGTGKAVEGVACFTLEPVAKGKSTELLLEHRMSGQVDAQMRSGYEAGWKDLLGVRLKELAEKGTRLGLKGAPTRKRGKTVARKRTVPKTIARKR